MNVASGETTWERGRLDGAVGPSKVLFGRVYEDVAIELAAFRPGGRIFCIASAGCTAMTLAAKNPVVAVDINPVQLAYARQRLEGYAPLRGTAEKVMAFGRAFAPLVGWWPEKVRAFLALEDPAIQIEFWRQHLDTWRFRTAFDSLLRRTPLRLVYASEFLTFLPSNLGAVFRARMERCFARHPNRFNPYARALLLGEIEDEFPRPEPSRIELHHADAAAWLEAAPAASFDGFSLSNILDGAEASYRKRLFAAVERTARPGATVVLRSFAEPPGSLTTNHAADDRSLLWGIVDVRPAKALGSDT